MGLFRRKPKLPADRRPPLARDERVLAWAATTGGDHAVVATNLGLWLPGRDERLGWHQIHKAAWDGRQLAVTAAEQAGERAGERDGYQIMVDAPALTYPLVDPGELPHQVRARVTRSVGYTAHHVGGAGGVRVAARRVPGVDGLTWTVRFDAGSPPEDEAALVETDRLVAEAQASLPTPETA